MYGRRDSLSCSKVASPFQQAGIASPIHKAAGRMQSPSVSARSSSRRTRSGNVGRSGEAEQHGDAFRFLSDLDGVDGTGRESGGLDQFLRNIYGLDDGKFHACNGTSGFAPDAARVLGRILG